MGCGVEPDRASGRLGPQAGQERQQGRVGPLQEGEDRTGRAGLVFLDFEGRRLLHVTGTTRLHFDTDEAQTVTGGTGRSWDLSVTRWVEGALPESIDAELLERSRFNPR